MLKYYLKIKRKIKFYYISFSFFTTNENWIEYLRVFNFNKKLRLGRNEDGGYIIGDINTAYDLYISCGVGDEESFSRDFINKYNFGKKNCFALDGTVDSYPVKYEQDVIFIRKNISYFNNERNTDLSFLYNRFSNIFLKMDIEGSEYEWIISLTESDLKRFSQIVIEFHGITNNDWDIRHLAKVHCFKKLAKTHYLIHAHGNNYSPVFNGIPSVIELTYINKNQFDVELHPNSSKLPVSDLDYPNDPGKPDIVLEKFPFISS
jgi:hypothetical protein